MKLTKVIRDTGNKQPRGVMFKNERYEVNKIARLQIVRYLSSFGLILGIVCCFSTASGADDQTSLASFEGGTIDLSEGWGMARICDVTSEGTNCFTGQSEYQAWIDAGSSPDGVTPLTDCSSGLKLYENIDYGGSELILSSEANWINLSTYGFSDVVSSFKVGACSISMTDGSNGSGNVYPGPTSPGSNVSWIGSAWNDRIKSVYIY